MSLTGISQICCGLVVLQDPGISQSASPEKPDLSPALIQHQGDNLLLLCAYSIVLVLAIFRNPNVVILPVLQQLHLLVCPNHV